MSFNVRLNVLGLKFVLLLTKTNHESTKVRKHERVTIRED